MKKLINVKDWGHSIYNAHLDKDGDYTQLIDNVTGVVAICIDENEKVVLMGNEPLGGHVEKGESIEGALKREVLEEGGIELERWRYFGHYEIVLKDTAPEEYKDKCPKVGYILFFLAKGHKVMDPYGVDAKNTEVVDISIVLNSSKYHHEMLKEGLKLYPSYIN